MDETSCYLTLVPPSQTTRHHISEDHNVHIDCVQKLKRKIFICLLWRGSSIHSSAFIQGIQKRMVRFQKLTRNFSPYTGTTYTVSSSNCPSFSYATSSSLLMLTAGPRGRFPRWRRSRKRRLRCVFSKPRTKLTLHCNHRSGHLKTEYTESLFLLRRHLGNWPRGPAVNMRSELLVAHEKLGQLLLLTVYVVPV